MSAAVLPAAVGRIESTPEELRGDVIGALIEQGHGRAEAKSAVAGIAASDFSTMFREALQWLRQPRAREGVPELRVARTSKPEPRGGGGATQEPDRPRLGQGKGAGFMKKQETKKCAGYNRECDEQISVKKTSGLCTRCYANKNYAEHHGITPKAAKKAANGKNGNGNGHASRDSGLGTRVALEVNEEQLNRFLTGLPLADKRALAQSWLSGEEA